MIRTITEREIVVCKDDLEIITGMLSEFNVDVVGKCYSYSNKDIVKLLVISEPGDFDGALGWFEKNYDGMISVLQ